MTQDEIIEMARQASAGNDDKNIFFEFVIEELETFAALVAAKEREACAKVADGYVGADPIASTIRARGEQA
jgi:hypothetical protein